MNQELATYQTRLRQLLPALRERYGVASLAIFGSYIRGTQRLESDLDVLATFLEAPTLFQLVDVENELTDVLGIKVDLVPRSALKPHIGARILREMVPV